MLTRIRPPGIINAETDNDVVSEEGAATGSGTWSEGAEVLGDGAAASLFEWPTELLRSVSGRLCCLTFLLLEDEDSIHTYYEYL